MIKRSNDEATHVELLLVFFLDRFEHPLLVGDCFVPLRKLLLQLGHSFAGRIQLGRLHLQVEP